MKRRVAMLFSRCVDIALIGLSVALFFVDGAQSLLFWNLTGVLYLLIRVRRYRRARTGRAGEWLSTLLPSRLGFLFTLLTGFSGISAGVTIVLGDEVFGEGLAAALGKALAVPAVLIAWAILHFGYAERYAQAYFAALPERRLTFPGQDEPTFADFTYYAFTIGVSFAASDVETSTSSARAQVLPHAVLSFIYNTATLGIAIGVLTGK